MLTDGKGAERRTRVEPRRPARRLPRHGRDGVSYDLYHRRARLTTSRAAPGVQRLPEELVGRRTGRPTTPNYSSRNFVSANESHLYVMDIATAALTPVSEGDEPASVSQAQFTAGRPRRLPGHQPRQRVRAAAARGPGHRRGRNTHRPHSLGHRKLRAQRRRPLSRLGGERRRHEPADGGRHGQTHRDRCRRCPTAASAASRSIAPASGWRCRWRARSRRATCSCWSSSATRWCATRGARPVPSIRCSSCRPNWCAFRPSIATTASTGRFPRSSIRPAARPARIRCYIDIHGGPESQAHAGLQSVHAIPGARDGLRGDHAQRARLDAATARPT